MNVPIINKTMDLSECREAWTYDETYQAWCLEDIIYTPKPGMPLFQRLSVFAPKAYMSAPGVIDETTAFHGYTARKAPVIFETNSAGYMQMPHTWLGGPRNYAQQYLTAGYVYVTCGNRGHESKGPDGRYNGKSPMNLIDLKMAIRFLRHNKTALPGDFDKIITTGWSAGGAMSSLLALTGDNRNYEELLAQNGAFMEESDAVFASQIYCPIIDLEHADLAYEWMFQADKENEPSPAGPPEIMSPFKEALSGKLSEKYIRYFNSLGMKHPVTGEPLVIGADGRSGNAYELLLESISSSATTYLNKLEKGELPVTYSAEDYLKGNYEYEKPAPMGSDPAKPGEKSGADGAAKGQEDEMMQGFAGPDVHLGAMNHAKDSEGPKSDHLPGEDGTDRGLGFLMLRPPKGVEFNHSEPPMVTVKGEDKTGWLSYENGQAKVTDLDQYVLHHRRRMKPCTSFDVLPGESGENKVFGDAAHNVMHFCREIPEAIEELKDAFPVEYENYYRAYTKDLADAALERRKYLINPLNFIGTEERSAQAAHYRIRVGASDADTALQVSMTLAVKLQNAGKPVDYQMVWDQPHCRADYEGDLVEWIEQIVR